MTQQQRGLLGILCLATAGFVSGLAAPDFPPTKVWQIAVFPLVLAFTLWLYCRIRPIPLLIPFVLACLGSFPIAFAASFVGGLLGMGLGSWDDPHGTSRTFLVAGAFGGIMGALVITFAFYALFLPSRWWRSLMKAAVCSLAGGLFAVVGVTFEIDPDHSLTFAVATWQTGVGALLGTILWWERRNAAQPLSHDSAPVTSDGQAVRTVGLVVACAFAVTVWFRVGQLRRYHNAALEKQAALAEAARRGIEEVNAHDRERARLRDQEIAQQTAQLIAEAPPGYETARVEKEPIDQVVILPSPTDIYFAGPPSADVLPGRVELGEHAHVLPMRGWYRVGYRFLQRPGQPIHHAWVSVEVTAYPNPAWAQYELDRHTHVFYSYSKPAKKFGSHVFYEYRSSSSPTYYWLSGSKVIVVTCYPDDELMLRRYLTKYPSSLKMSASAASYETNSTSN
jgi:hypothetical protein